MNGLRIGVDARSLNRPHLRGIGKVVTKIVEYSNPDVQWTLLSDRSDLPFHRPEHPRCETIIFEQRGHRFGAWEQWALPKRIRREQFDVFLSPANSAPLWQRCPTVAIIHDTIAWNSRWADESQASLFRRRLLPLAFRRAAGVATISEASANDIGHRWKSLRSRIRIIPNGVDDQFLQSQSNCLSPALRKHNISTPYFVYFGGAVARKRLSWAVEVFDRANIPGCQLVICGLEAAKQNAFRETLPNHLKQSIRILGFIDEAEMPCLIRQSLGVIYPTLYEGFGLPALESQACGTACLFSAVSSLKELIGPGAIVLPPEDPEPWSIALRELAESAGLDAQTKIDAHNWAQQFHWRETSRRYLELFADVSAQHSAGDWRLATGDC